MKDRIAHLAYAGTSGATRVALDIAGGSQRPGRHAFVLFGTVPPREDYVDQLEQLGCEWHYVPKRRGPGCRGYFAAAQALRELDAGAIVLHGSRLAPVGLLLRLGENRVPIIAVQHGPAREVLSCWRRAICTIFSAAADKTVAVSKYLSDLMGSYRLAGWAARGHVVIANGVDVGYWQAEPTERQSGGAIRVGMVATLDAHKDQPTLLRAVARLRAMGNEVQAVLVGGGPREEELRKLSREFGIESSVTFMGDLSRHEVREALHGLDMVVHSSQGESFGMAVAEAMAAARPIVASDSGALRELVEHERTGLLFPAGDAEALAKAMARIIETPALARRLALAGRAHVEDHFSSARMAREYEALIDRSR